MVWGADHKLDSAEACCKACVDYKPSAAHDMAECNGELKSLRSHCTCVGVLVLPSLTAFHQEPAVLVPCRNKNRVCRHWSPLAV